MDRVTHSLQDNKANTYNRNVLQSSSKDTGSKHVGEKKQRNAKPSRQPSSIFTCQNGMSCHVMSCHGSIQTRQQQTHPIPFSRLLRPNLPPASLAWITPQPITSPKAPTRKDSHPPKSGTSPDDSPSRNTNHQPQPSKPVLQSKN